MLTKISIVCVHAPRPGHVCSCLPTRLLFALVPQVSIFVSGPGTTRLLNVHPDCILAVFPADTPLPTPSRLEWLTGCGEFVTVAYSGYC